MKQKSAALIRSLQRSFMIGLLLTSAACATQPTASCPLSVKAPASVIQKPMETPLFDALTSSPTSSPPSTTKHN